MTPLAHDRYCDARLEVLGEREPLDFWLERATFG
jgi:hypothetical protein